MPTEQLPFADTADFDDARRGFAGTIDPMRIEDAEGRVVWEMDAYRFVEGDPPSTVNPSLWRQAQLLGIHGLFEVAPGFYQSSRRRDSSSTRSAKTSTRASRWGGARATCMAPFWTRGRRAS